MAHYEDDVFPVTRITAGAVGEPGRRIFVIQAQVGGRIASWLIQKEQALALSRSIPHLLADVQREFPELGEPLVAAVPNLALHEPLQPQFRVGGLGLGYDRLHDLVVLTLIDADRPPAGEMEMGEDAGAQDRFHLFTTRGQALLLSAQMEKVVAAGRPYCPSCGEPMDEFGHFCSPTAGRTKPGADYLQ